MDPWNVFCGWASCRDRAARFRSRVADNRQRGWPVCRRRSRRNLPRSECPRRLRGRCRPRSSAAPFYPPANRYISFLHDKILLEYTSNVCTDSDDCYATRLSIRIAAAVCSYWESTTFNKRQSRITYINKWTNNVVWAPRCDIMRDRARAKTINSAGRLTVSARIAAIPGASCVFRGEYPRYLYPTPDSTTLSSLAVIYTYTRIESWRLQLLRRLFARDNDVWTIFSCATMLALTV